MTMGMVNAKHPPPLQRVPVLVGFCANLFKSASDHNLNGSNLKIKTFSCTLGLCLGPTSPLWRKHFRDITFFKFVPKNFSCFASPEIIEVKVCHRQTDSVTNSLTPFHGCVDFFSQLNWLPPYLLHS